MKDEEEMSREGLGAPIKKSAEDVFDLIDEDS